MVINILQTIYHITEEEEHLNDIDSNAADKYMEEPIYHIHLGNKFFYYVITCFVA